MKIYYNKTKQFFIIIGLFLYVPLCIQGLSELLQGGRIWMLLFTGSFAIIFILFLIWQLVTFFSKEIYIEFTQEHLCVKTFVYKGIIPWEALSAIDIYQRKVHLYIAERQEVFVKTRLKVPRKMIILRLPYFKGSPKEIEKNLFSLFKQHHHYYRVNKNEMRSYICNTKG